MTQQLRIRSGQFTSAGRKALNQDHLGIYQASASQVASKGIALALADGISSSQVSQIASQSAINSFFADYYGTSEAWSVKTSGQRVLAAINSWLYSQTRRSEHRYNLDKGYVCTFTGMVLKGHIGHIFHAGDSRVYQVHGQLLEPLTQDHRVQVSGQQHYLQRALGMGETLDLDYRQISLAVGACFVLCTDGIYEFVSDKDIANTCIDFNDDLDLAAKRLVERAYNNGSDDNLSVQIIRIEALPEPSAQSLHEQSSHLPLPPLLNAQDEFEGFRIERQLYSSARSHVYLAQQLSTQKRVVIKVPSQESYEDEAQLERFLLEDWIAKRIDNPHVLKAVALERNKTQAYIVTEYIEGQSLEQWLIDHPKPSLEQVRDIIEQIAKGLRAFHRLEMLHQDLRPANIMIDQHGNVKIIDFGSTWVAGLEELSSSISRHERLGTAQYSAPEYFIGDYGSERSDLFSLAVIAYQMLSGRLPYGNHLAKAHTRAAQKRLSYQSVCDEHRDTPIWMDFALRKALSIDPNKRYEVSSEFLLDMRRPNKAFAKQSKPPLLERNPTVFWQGVSAFLTLVIIALLAQNQGL